MSMHAAVRSAERLPSAPTDRPYSSANQGRVDEAFHVLGALAARIVTDPNPSHYLLDLSSQDGVLQAVWCRDHSSGCGPTSPEIDPAEITAGAYGPVNAERYVRAQKALSTLLLELTRPGCHGSATLKVRGLAGEIADEIRAECHRQWRF
jgi:hypothetical protein